MEEQLKKTLADYLKTDAAAIGSDTVIDRSALGNSIAVHRLYAAFSQQGYSVTNYNTIRTYGDLKSRLSLNGNGNPGNDTVVDTSVKRSSTTGSTTPAGANIGIDIEAVDAFEVAVDYREHSFYRDNFTEREISYCLLQADPRSSFAGLFAAKEAVVKADNGLMGTNFNRLEIEHEKSGKPRFKNFALSISHAAGFAVAVAVANNGFNQQNSSTANEPEFSIQPVRSSKNASPLAVVALVLSLLAFLLALLCLLK